MPLLKNGKYFITGTDTDCGKTYVTVQLLKQASENNISTLGLKPVACGGYEDTLLLQQASTFQLPCEKITPFYFERPISPHLAASFENKSLSVDVIVNAIQEQWNKAQLCLLEGAGGVLVPINQHETMLDLMQAINIPVILVVGMRLGCLNHALLSLHALKQANINIEGWVATQVDPQMQSYEENIQTLKNKLDVPLLAQFNHNLRESQNIFLSPNEVVIV